VIIPLSNIFENEVDRVGKAWLPHNVRVLLCQQLASLLKVAAIISDYLNHIFWPYIVQNNCYLLQVVEIH
jgi:hypothetical protein